MKLMFTQSPPTFAAICAPSTVWQSARLREIGLPVASQLAARVLPPSHQEWVQVPTMAPFGAAGQGATLPGANPGVGVAQYLNQETKSVKLDGIRGVPPRGRPV